MTDESPEAGAAPRQANVGTGDASAPVIVAVGASGASMQSAERLLRSLAPDPNRAVILVLRDREALDFEQFRRSLDGGENLQLATIEANAPIEGGKLYLSDPGIILTVEDGRFRCREAQDRPGQRGTIDSFFVSLAEEENERAIGVILRGTAGDGTLGIAALKEQGGLTIAERGAEETAHEIATSNAPGALADFLLAADEIAGRVAIYERYLSSLAEEHLAAAISAEVSASLGAVAAILRNKTGHDFHGYKKGTFMRRVQRRMQVVDVADIGEYLEVLRENPDEVQNLFNDLLIGVTQFFRDPREFDALQTKIIPQLLEGKGAGDNIRVWVLGCATGEEAYSIAILLREHMANLDPVPTIQIFATDIDVRALAAARVGRYPKSIAGDLTPERLARWFVREGDTYCVLKELREMCIFSSHNLIRDAPFSRLDLISCRNLLIYLSSELQSSVIPLLHFALRPGGFLFLGNSENVTRHTNLFEPVGRRSRIFRRLETANRIPPTFPITTVRAASGADHGGLPRQSRTDGSLARRAERIVERFAPAYAIVNEQSEVLHFSGRIGRYLEPTSGPASLDLLNLVHRDLRAELRTALSRASDQNQGIDVDGIAIEIDGEDSLVELHVEPVNDRPDSPRSFVVVFKDGRVRPHSDRVAGFSAPEAVRDEYVQRLENDLRLSRERLEATIEELESTNEELKASNEEYQSLNEELQSANEELETSKEELQSINEELTTVNGELGHRVHELTRATSDLKNFLESTQIATLFLDNELKVMNFTPAVTELFHLLETDIGRSLSHIKGRVPLEVLFDHIGSVQRTLSTVEHTIDSPATGARYIARVLPYRSVDNFIAGVVITFTNITSLTRAENALRASEARFRAIFESASDYAIITADPQLRVTGWSPGAANLFGWEQTEVLGQSAGLVFTEEDRAAGAPEREAETASREGRAQDERWHVRKDGSRFWGSGSMAPLNDGGLIGYVKILRDRTETRAAEERQRVLLAELQHRVRNTLGVVRSIARRTAETSGTVEDYAMHFEGRLDAFARVQAAVTRNPSAGIDLEYMVAEELLAYGGHEGKQVNIRGPEIKLRPKAAETFGLALHELATNAVKYGALSNTAGRVDVRWKIKKGGPASLAFEWTETGIKLDGARPSRRGFGTELLERTLNYELKATTVLEFGEAGLRCRIELPLTERFVAPR